MAKSISVAVADIETIRFGVLAAGVVLAGLAVLALLPHAVSRLRATPRAAIVLFTVCVLLLSVEVLGTLDGRESPCRANLALPRGWFVTPTRQATWLASPI
jgi:hypothetical protein